MPNKIHFDANSIPSCDRFGSESTDISLCSIATENSPVTACESEVTCRSCRRSRYFRKNFPALALAPRKGHPDRKVRSIRVTEEEMAKIKQVVEGFRGVLREDAPMTEEEFAKVKDIVNRGRKFSAEFSVMPLKSLENQS